MIIKKYSFSFSDEQLKHCMLKEFGIELKEAKRDVSFTTYYSN